VLRGRVFPVVSARVGISSSNNRSARHATAATLGMPNRMATTAYHRVDFPLRREERRLTKIRLASKSYIMRRMPPPCGERRLRRESMQALPLCSLCQEGGLRRQLRANVPSMFFGQGVASSAPDDYFPCNALRRGHFHVRTTTGFVATPLEISA
jgi:hypothetical protein